MLRQLRHLPQQLIVSVCAILACLDATAQTQTKSTQEGFGEIAWLAGCWQGKAGKFEFVEQWMRPGGGVMLGMGRTLMDGKLSSHEAMRIEIDADGSLTFVAKPFDKPEARFPALVRDAGGVAFENPKHDFPQRIIYRRQADGSLLARIEGMRGGQLRGVDYPMQRAACP